jgi:hypothetical protein
MVYDALPIKDHEDPLINRINDLVQRLIKAAYPGEHVVEFFPWMQNLPRFLTPWKPWAEEWHRKDSEMFLKYYREVRDRVVCFVYFSFVPPRCITLELFRSPATSAQAWSRVS